jgi:hypothetical protein
MWIGHVSGMFEEMLLRGDFHLLVLLWSLLEFSKSTWLCLFIQKNMALPWVFVIESGNYNGKLVGCLLSLLRMNHVWKLLAVGHALFIHSEVSGALRIMENWKFEFICILSCWTTQAPGTGNPVLYYVFRETCSCFSETEICLIKTSCYWFCSSGPEQRSASEQQRGFGKDSLLQVHSLARGPPLWHVPEWALYAGSLWV